MRALRTAASGMAAQQLNVEVISNNIANMNTVGFKKQRAEFQDLLYQNVERMGAQSSSQGTVVPTGIQIGAGVKAGAVYRVTEQGTPQQTGNPYDMAIDGRGYFQVTLPSGEIGYTRAGNLALSPEGQIVTDDGYPLEPAISIPQDTVKLTISKTGLVQATQQGQTAPTTVGQIQLATFFNEAGLEAIGDNLLLETAASGAANIGSPGDVGFGQILQAYTEASNVDAVSEISALIIAQRAYEMNSKVISTADQMMSVTSQIVRNALALTAVFAAIAGAASAGSVVLKSNPVDDDGRVTLGDLFEGAGAASEVVVAQRVGPSVVLEAGALQAQARQAGLDWDNPTGLRRVAVRRAAAVPVQTAAASAGQTARPAFVSAGAQVIARNDMVRVTYQVGGVNLSVMGKALRNAALGEPVAVMNTSSNRIIDAVASGPGQALAGPAADMVRANPQQFAAR
ncbi:hypothetical protein LTR94_018696 [Friedmanniomyces endolithicus]|nr:hypothetical protein LTR94_018696 [Friedmanniomyces endolithicus]